MHKTIIDSSAWIEYFEGTPKGQKVRQFLAQTDSFPIITDVIVTEVLTRYLRLGKPIDMISTALRTNATLVQHDFPLSEKTAEIYVHERKANPKFGVADAHIVATARQHRAKIITCDFDFSGITEAIVIR